MNSNTIMRMDESEEPPLAEYHPPHHPDVMFRAYIAAGGHSIVHLGGEEYWINGTWMALAPSSMVLVKDRVFRVSELAESAALVDLPPPPAGPLFGLS